MSGIKFEKTEVVARIRNPLHNFKLTEEVIEIRRDPLLGYTTRITPPKGLEVIPENDELPDFVAKSMDCFFCEGRVTKQTPMLPVDIYPDGRIKRGEALLFPNLSGYGEYSGVCIFSQDHFIPIKKFTVQLIKDALLACQAFFRVCGKGHDRILYPTIGWNYLLPAGSSLLHPHIQPVLDSVPTHYHEQVIQKCHNYRKSQGTGYWSDLIESERSGPRFLYETNHGTWLTPFAPTGFNEINGIFKTKFPFSEWEASVVHDLAQGIFTALQFYATTKRNSLNMALFSPPSGKEDAMMPTIVKIVTRPVFSSLYRNDITFFERLHRETVLDQRPEDVAKTFRELSI